MNRVNASIIIAVRNRNDDLAELLESLAQQPLAQTGTEVIIVDDASTDDIAATVASSPVHGVQVVHIERPAGPSHARNLGADTAQGDIFLFLDSDGVVTPGWLEAMLAKHDGQTVLLGCAVDYIGGKVQGLPRRATFLGKSLKCRPGRANTGPSCNLGVPRKLFQQLEGFDEDIPYYFEDSDLCIRARTAGANFVYIPDAVFRHKGSPRKKGDAIRMQEHNSTYAMLKAYHKQPLMRATFTIANALWLFMRLLAWTLRGKWEDARRLWNGWRSAYERYNRNPPTSNIPAWRKMEYEDYEQQPFPRFSLKALNQNLMLQLLGVASEGNSEKTIWETLDKQSNPLPIADEKDAISFIRELGCGDQSEWLVWFTHFGDLDDLPFFTLPNLEKVIFDVYLGGASDTYLFRADHRVCILLSHCGLEASRYWLAPELRSSAVSSPKPPA